MINMVCHVYMCLNLTLFGLVLTGTLAAVANKLINEIYYPWKLKTYVYGNNAAKLTTISYQVT